MLFQHHLLKILSLLYCFAFVLSSKISLLYLWRSISGFSILLHWFTRLFFDQHHTVLTTNPEMPPVWSMKLITYRMELWSSSYLDLWSVEAETVHVTNLKCTSLPPFSGKWQKPSLNLSRGRNAVAQKNEKNWTGTGIRYISNQHKFLSFCLNLFTSLPHLVDLKQKEK